MIGARCIILLVYMCGCSTMSIEPMRYTHPPTTVMTCGIDRLPKETIEEGTADIESFPWLGLLMYPAGGMNPNKTTVILITKEIAISTALDIDSYPKDDFRARSRVLLGYNYSGPYIRVKGYTFHPDFTRTTFSSLALIQLENQQIKHQLFPICPPPQEFGSMEDVYALAMEHNDRESTIVKVYKMEYVETTQCQEFYKNFELDIETIVPTHLVCARGLFDEHCVWQSGTALVIRDNRQWKLLGVGIYGPGCESPARFLDYGMYHPWVKSAISHIGQPTISRIGANYIVLRRTTTHLQRFGDCDPEETEMELFTDSTTLEPPFPFKYNEIGFVKYNISLDNKIEYHCIKFRVWNENYANFIPVITLRRWNTSQKAKYGNSTQFFYVEIKFKEKCRYEVSAFGSEVQDVSEDEQKNENLDWTRFLAK